jgi:hypothetical protein
MLKKNKSFAPLEWFKIQYENLPFFCFSCRLIGHFESACPSPQARDADGKLSYEHKKLRAPKDRRRKPPSFAHPAAESYGSSSYSGRKKGVDQLMHNSKGSGNEPISNQVGADGGFEDGVMSSKAGIRASGARVTKTQEYQSVHHDFRKRKGSNSKAPESSIQL